MTTTDQENLEDLRWSLTASTVMHVLFFVIIYFGVPGFFKSSLPPMVHPLVPINIVDIGEITNTSLKDGNSASQQPAPSSQPKPAPTPPSAPTPPAEKPEVAPPDALAPKPQQKPTPPAPPKEEAKPQQAADPLASVLKNVAKMKPVAPQNDSKVNTDIKEKSNSTALSAGGSGQGGNGPSLSDRLTISEEDALRRQISLCWNMPVGAREAENLVVEVLIEVNPDRTVRDAQIVDTLRMASDRYFRAAAEAALRALRHPKCSPLLLNPDKYEEWKTIRFNFDPRDML